MVFIAAEPVKFGAAVARVYGFAGNGDCVVVGGDEGFEFYYFIFLGFYGHEFWGCV